LDCVLPGGSDVAFTSRSVNGVSVQLSDSPTKVASLHFALWSTPMVCAVESSIV
jgi:hypothetical protein